MFTKTLETWNTRKGTVVKLAVRDELGRFHGATNFRQESDWSASASVTVKAAPVRAKS